tara:strand:- start:179 stop:655 length:477 start_codon:yes stop_codon:yes gene_type:complete
MKLINKKENILLGALFIISLLLSHLNIFSFTNQNTNPEYFIALFTIILNSKHWQFSLIKVFLLGLIIDAFIGLVLGQYAFSFLMMVLFHKIYNHYLNAVSEEQKSFLHFFTVLIGVVCLKLVAMSNLAEDFDFVSIILIFILTFLTFFIFQFLSKRLI